MKKLTAESNLQWFADRVKHYPHWCETRGQIIIRAEHLDSETFGLFIRVPVYDKARWAFRSKKDLALFKKIYKEYIV